MADVTISSLPQGTPSGNSAIPFSTGSNTLRVPVSAIFQNTGNVGIGTSSPNGTFAVVRDGGNGIILQSSASSPNTSIILGTNYNNTGRAIIAASSEVTTRPGLSIVTGDTERLTIDNQGNVGIGTTAPTAKLDVNGTIKANTLSVPGALLQVVQAVKTDTQVFSPPLVYQNWQDIAGLSVTLTPKGPNSRMLINVALAFMGDVQTQGYCRILRNGTTPVGVGGDYGRVRASFNKYINQTNEIPTTGFMFLDDWNSPDPVSYRLQVLAQQAPGYIYVNRSETWSTASNNSCTSCSTLIVQEISG